MNRCLLLIVLVSLLLAGQALAVKYRGYWFWIDETDQETKAAFRLLRTLWSMSIAKAVNTVSPPLLTLPVGN